MRMNDRHNKQARTEAEKFDELADRWWDKKGPLQTLHDMNPTRLGYIDKRVLLAGRRVLDVGCGGGILTETLARRGARAEGLDASAAVLEVAQEHARAQALEIEYHVGEPEDLSVTRTDYYDTLTCMELLEHVSDPAALLQCCARLLRPGGDLIISTINRNLRSYLGAIVSAERLLGLLPKGTHDYARLIRPAELARWLRKADFYLVDITGMLYLPGVRYCALTDDPGINYLVHARLRR